MTLEEERKLAYYMTPYGYKEYMTSDLAHEEYQRLLRKQKEEQSDRARKEEAE